MYNKYFFGFIQHVMYYAPTTLHKTGMVIRIGNNPIIVVLTLGLRMTECKDEFYCKVMGNIRDYYSTPIRANSFWLTYPIWIR